MDNVVQNINIYDIIPSNFQPSREEKRKIEELAHLIKNFGLLDPILVRPKNGKYEIVLGIEKYHAAITAGLIKIPAIIKEVDDETFSNYSNIDNKEKVSFNSLPTETFSNKEKNSDVINLSELSKIKLEYERDDVKMNNGQFNNEMNNNFGQPDTNQINQGPTFGGRFFPSLEDEPTNMNMMGGLNPQSVVPTVAPSIEPSSVEQQIPNMNNNLIDLTDLSVEKEQTPMPVPNFGTPIMNTPIIEPNKNINFNQPQPNNFDSQNLVTNPIPINNNIINLENLQNNNPAVKPIGEPTPMEILNADFGAPSPMPNEFNMRPGLDLNIPQSQEFEESVNTAQPNFGISQPIMELPTEPTIEKQQPMPNFEINTTPTIQPSFENNLTMQNVENNIIPSKDVAPVTSTIKALANSLSAFGYKINITEEDLLNVSKITIEVEK